MTEMKKPDHMIGLFCFSGAGPTGLEPATSALTGRRSNQTELRSPEDSFCCVDPSGIEPLTS